MKVMHLIKHSVLASLLCAATAASALPMHADGAGHGHADRPAASQSRHGSSISIAYRNDNPGALGSNPMKGAAVFGWCGMECGDLTLTLAGSALFSLSSIDFGGLGNRERGGVKITGFFDDGRSLSDTFSMADLVAMSEFAGFSQLKRLQVTILTDFVPPAPVSLASPATGELIVAESQAQSPLQSQAQNPMRSQAVPEPGAMALLGIGVAMLGFTLRKRQTACAARATHPSSGRPA